MNNTTLQTLRNHPAVSEILVESDHGKTTYFINLKRGFATDNGGGQTSGSERTLRGVAAFLRGVAAVPTTTDNETLLRNLRLAAQALADSTGCTVTVRNDHGVLVYETE